MIKGVASLWGFFWVGIVGICSIAGGVVAAPHIYRWVKNWLRVRQHRGWLKGLPWFVPHRRRLKHLEGLVRLLGQAQEGLNLVDRELVREIQYDLGRVAWHVYTDAWPYVAVYSYSDERQCLAIRNLSQVEDDGSRTDGRIERARTVIKGVEKNPFTSDQVKKVARAALEELERRQQLKVQ